MSGLLVVERIDWTGPAYARQRARTPSALSSGQDIRRYRGFDGWPWPDDPLLEGVVLEGGLASVAEYENVKRYLMRVSAHKPCDVIFVGRTEAPRVAIPPAFAFRGYDFGYFDSEYSHFSALIHEVAFGAYEELRYFAQMLNEGLLLASLEVAAALHDVRTKLVEAGADLELVGTCGALAIFAPDLPPLL
jgi:hypothetical protein